MTLVLAVFNLVDDSGLQIDEQRAGHIFAFAALVEESMKIVLVSLGFLCEYTVTFGTFDILNFNNLIIKSINNVKIFAKNLIFDQFRINSVFAEWFDQN